MLSYLLDVWSCFNPSLLGGYATAELNEILEYEKSSKQWLLVGNLFEARYYHAITTVLLRDVEQLCVSKKVKK